MNVATRPRAESRSTASNALMRYFDRSFDTDAVKLLPGEYCATRDDVALVTVLGSCVAACIRDAEAGVGGMNHFMLPDTSSVEDRVSGSARYGVNAMEVLINDLISMGARRTSLEAKVFGGARVMASLADSDVGSRNAQFVIDYLGREAIPVRARDLLDTWPRKVYFFPLSGRVMIRKLIHVDNDTVSARERAYAEQLTRTPESGDVRLFGQGSQ